MNRKVKTKVLFVGSFRKPGTSTFFGGMMYASTTLVEAEGGEDIEWISLDSTARSNRGRSQLEIIYRASQRMLRYLYLLVFKRPKTVLLFMSHSMSVVEKGTMAVIAHWLGKRVVLAPRSGIIKDNLAGSKRFGRFLRWVLKHVDVLVCQGESWRVFYQDYVDIKQVELLVIPNWIDAKNHLPLPKLNENNPTFTVGFIGWITANKGVYDLREAAKSLADEELRFLLAGNGDALDDLRSKGKNFPLPNFQLIGWIDDERKQRFWRSIDVLILPSYREGYPNVLLEAMALGLPVIASRVGAIPDLIDDGRTGILIDPASPDQIVKAISRLKANSVLAEEMGSAARQSILQQNEIKGAVLKFRRALTSTNT